jgi:hypothetical protein
VGDLADRQAQRSRQERCAIPIGEADIARTLGGTLKQAKSFREIDDEPPAKSLIAIDSGTTKLSKSEY